jgi:hypothetical protein
MFCPPGLVFGGAEGVGVPFSCFALPGSFSSLRWASGRVFMFCAAGLIFGVTQGVGSRFHVLRSRTRLRRYRGRRVLFFIFCAPRLVLGGTEGLSPIFMFCPSGHVFGGAEGVGSRFHILRSRTRFRGAEVVGCRFFVLRSRARFRRYEGRRVQFSCFALPGSFSALSRASGPVFMNCAPGLIFGGTEGVGSRFHVLRARPRFRRNRGRSVPFSCYAFPDAFWVVPRASGPVFMFCTPGLVFKVPKGVGSRFHVLRSRTRFRRYRGRQVPFSCFVRPNLFCAAGLDFGVTEGVGSRFHVLRARTLFRRNRGRRVPFSFFVLPDSFLAVLRATGTVFLFCAPELIFDSTGSVRSRFHVSLSRTRFSAVPRASGPVCMFCVPAIIIGGTEGVGSRFPFLRSRTHFRRYRGRRVPF